MSAEAVADQPKRPLWVEGPRWGLRAIAVGAGALYLTAMNPFGVILWPELLNQASLVALVSIPVALLFDVIAPPTGGRAWPFVRLLVGVPATLIALMWIAMASGAPGVVNRVTAPDGRQYLLGISAMPTDVDYQLWKSVGPGGLFWEPAEMLTWSEDGSFTEDPRLILVRDRWLMVRRGGIWTDCYEIRGETLVECGGGQDVPDWQKPEAWHAASAAMTLKVGATPEES